MKNWGIIFKMQNKWTNEYIEYFRENVVKTFGYVPGYQPAETNVIKLNTNENPYPPSPHVLKAIAEIKPEQLRRYLTRWPKLFAKQPQVSTE